MRLTAFKLAWLSLLWARFMTYTPTHLQASLLTISERLSGLQIVSFPDYMAALFQGLCHHPVFLIVYSMQKQRGKAQWLTISRHTGGGVPVKNFKALLVISCSMTGTFTGRREADQFVSYNNQAWLPFECLLIFYPTSLHCLQCSARWKVHFRVNLCKWE